MVTARLPPGLLTKALRGTGSAGLQQEPPWGAEGRGSKSACTDLDGPKDRRLRRRAANAVSVGAP